MRQPQGSYKILDAKLNTFSIVFPNHFFTFTRLKLSEKQTNKQTKEKTNTPPPKKKEKKRKTDCDLR